MIGIMARKVGMTRVYIEGRGAVPVTVLETEPGYVTQVKTPETDSYSAIQVGWRPTDKHRRMNKALTGHFKKAGTPYLTRLKEIRVENPEEYKPGDAFGLDRIGELKFVDVIGNSKGRGFQGVVKRHGFHGGPMTHGSKTHRAPGAIGMCAWPGHTIKGQKMPGQYGNERTTTQNLEVVQIRTDENLILVRGAVPGHRQAWVWVQPAAKGGKGKAAKVKN